MPGGKNFGVGEMNGRISIASHRSVLGPALVLGRWLVVFGLSIAGVWGGVIWLQERPGVQALEFTEHVLAPETTEIGILGMAASDIDEDGDIDLVTAGHDGIKVYINDGNENFAEKIIDERKAERIQIIDLDGDGRSDLLVTIRDESTTVRWYRNEGEAEFSGTGIGTGTLGKAYAGDIDGDNDADIVTALTEGEEVTLQRWMNDGSGGFTATTMATSTMVESIHIADVNGNGFQDIVTVGGKGLQRWSTNDGYSWSRIDIDDGSLKGDVVITGDLNQDGKVDIITGEPDGDQVVFYKNMDNSTWQRNVLSGNADARSLQIVDLDEDGYEDLVVAGQDDNSIFWYRQGSDNSFTKSTLATGLQSVFQMVVADFDNDNDFDFAAGDHHRGFINWYERVAAKPVATAPASISQSTDGGGLVTFSTTLSDADRDPTKFRVLYSIDGANWYKPWLTQASFSAGSANLKNSLGYQVGWTNAIDTDAHDEVTVTLTWDTRSMENTGGPISGQAETVRLKIIPRDGTGLGEEAVSSLFTVDNAGPVIGQPQVGAKTENQISLSWVKGSDGSEFDYRIYYGTDHAEVLNFTSAVWDEDDDILLADGEATGTIIDGLTAATQYSFKLVAIDAYGNRTESNSVRAMMAGGTSPTDPGASPVPGGQAAEDGGTVVVVVTPDPEVPGEVVDGGEEIIDPALNGTGGEALPTPEPDKPAIEFVEPRVDAGSDQVVNVGELVILDGTNSSDPRGEELFYEWKQLSGVPVSLSGRETPTPSFTPANESSSYVFMLTVETVEGISASDIVTVATRQLVADAAAAEDEAAAGGLTIPEIPSLARLVLVPLDWFLAALSALAVLLLVSERWWGVLMARLGQIGKKKEGGGDSKIKGKVVDQEAEAPVPGAKVVLYDKLGDVVDTARTSVKGSFSFNPPAGVYTLAVDVKGLKFGSAVLRGNFESGVTVYTGGSLTVNGGVDAANLLLPVKPSGMYLGSSLSQVLKVWQILQNVAHHGLWWLLVLGATVNTVLLFWLSGIMFVAIEILYVALVGAKVFVDMRTRPSYGLVIDAISHVPIDLAVVRLYEQGTNRLVVTRVTNAQGKFFALPPPGDYTITVTRQGYAQFSKAAVKITSEHDATIQLEIDMMPVVPQGAVAMAA